MSRSVKNKIEDKSARIAVLGMGYVGLPLALNFAKAGYEVLGLDKDIDRVRRLNEQESYISDIPTEELKAICKTGRFHASTDFSGLGTSDVIIICVPTPLRRKYTPDVSYIVGAVKTIREYIQKGALVILESTTYPGTTREMILPELEATGLKCGRDFFLSFSPERIDPGNPDYDVTRIPKVVGGVDKKSGELTKSLYEKIIVKIHLVSSAEAAEMTKLLENSFRIINIGWINEVAMMAHHLGIDVWEVIDAAKTKPFGFMPFYPGLGVGGHCIPDDPLYLYWKAKQYGFSSRYIKLSADTNAGMPLYVIDRISTLLSGPGKSLRGKKILIMGVTYKKDVKDLRKSPPLKLIEYLQDRQAEVSYYDPIIPFLEIGKIHMKSVTLNRAAVREADCVVIATDHSDVNYKLVRDAAQLIFDTRNVYAGDESRKIVRI